MEENSKVYKNQRGISCDSTMLMEISSSGFGDLAMKVLHIESSSQHETMEFARKNAANFLSLANLLMGLLSVLCTLNGMWQCSAWLLLFGFMLDLADGAVARQLNTCSALGAKLDDFADFTSFGLATALLLHTSGFLDALLVVVYVLAVFTRLCFYSSGIPFMYRGLPCTYASAILACASLLTGNHTVLLRMIAVIMIFFMIDQGIYPHDKILESQLWKKMVFAGGVIAMLCSFSPLACLYHLVWSLSYILFPEALWSFKV
ncbi:transmembrane protein 269 isoform X2 [Bufo bufo]|uniref:transmembrane protein 269 isoform X2 n=1 Tax=Bufo bufo TaxID=8384 RepID=UPI001ABE4E3A|nr:transmembrane protein 269 isoform X2 [Bufo bufo]